MALILAQQFGTKLANYLLYNLLECAKWQVKVKNPNWEKNYLLR